MKISATINSSKDLHDVLVQTNDTTKLIHIPVKANGYGSSVNGGELLLLSLATCFCNDIYREAAKRNIIVTSVDIDFTGDFGNDGESGSNFQYKTRVVADASDEQIRDLIEHTDKIAEVHNTLRKGLNITLV